MTTEVTTDTRIELMREAWQLIKMELAAPHVDLTFRRVRGDGGPELTLRVQGRHNKWVLGRTYDMTLSGKVDA